MGLFWPVIAEYTTTIGPTRFGSKLLQTKLNHPHRVKIDRTDIGLQGQLTKLGFVEWLGRCRCSCSAWFRHRVRDPASAKCPRRISVNSSNMRACVNHQGECKTSREFVEFMHTSSLSQTYTCKLRAKAHLEY